MKSIRFKLNKCFTLELKEKSQVFELEDNSCLISITGEIDESLSYKLHIMHGDEKEVLLLDKSENALTKLLTAPYIKDEGIYILQIEALREGFRVISNQVSITVGSFINAEFIPTPEEQSILDQLIIDVGKKQNQLTAGANITIEGDVISATGGGGGSNVVMKYNRTEGVDLTVDGFTENLALIHNLQQTEGRMTTRYNTLKNSVNNLEELVNIDETTLNNILEEVYG